MSPRAAAGCTLCIFAKAPEPGRVKSRLAKDIGEQTALRIYEGLLAVTARVAAAWSGPVQVHGTGTLTRFADSPLAAWPVIPQHPGNLGERLAHGLTQALSCTRQDADSDVGKGEGEDKNKAIAIGTDCPDLDVKKLQAIEDLLQDHDAAFGPSNDGGYWSLGVGSDAAVRCCCADDLPWSQDSLLSTSQTRCTAMGLRHACGPTGLDVDTLADLTVAQAAGFLRD